MAVEDTLPPPPPFQPIKSPLLILGSLSDSLQEQVVTIPGNTKALWDHLKNIFHDNKDARAINLDNELRSINIGKMTVNEYCNKIQAMANRLKNLDCEVSEKNIVMFAVNGLDSWFATLAEIIRHREPLPTFETVCNMLLLKESSFNDDSSFNNGFEATRQDPYSFHRITKSTQLPPLRPVPRFSLLSQTPCLQRPHPTGTTMSRLTHPTGNDSPPSPSSHSLKRGVKPIDCLSLHTSSISLLPKNHSDALKDPQWRHTMYDEYNALVKNGTWLLIPRPAGVNMVRSMWFFKHKFHADRTLSRYKACLVANGSSEKPGVDFDETLTRQGSQVTYLLLYVDDIIFMASSTTLLQQLIGSLHREFDMTDLGELNYFLGISAVRHSTGLVLSQKKYALHLLEHAHMVNSNPYQTPVDTESKLGPDGVPVQDPTLYHSLACGIQYLTFTRSDLSYAVQQICLYMHDPREPHLAALKRILRYVQGTLDLGLHLYTSSTDSLVGYTDVDWAGCPFTRRSTSVTAGTVRVLHVPSRFQYANIFTKGLPSALFEEFCSSLSVWPPPAPTARAY
ncbi:ribonuclease H-like domain-containing protein [Tanacetum coccineum]